MKFFRWDDDIEGKVWQATVTEATLASIEIGYSFHRDIKYVKHI